MQECQNKNYYKSFFISFSVSVVMTRHIYQTINLSLKTAIAVVAVCVEVAVVDVDTVVAVAVAFVQVLLWSLLSLLLVSQMVLLVNT